MQAQNPKTAWWLQHKNDPTMVACMKEARRKYYYKNQEREQQRGREYYYKRKALAQAEGQRAAEAAEAKAADPPA